MSFVPDRENRDEIIQKYHISNSKQWKRQKISTLRANTAQRMAQSAWNSGRKRGALAIEWYTDRAANL